jgi:transcriptional regulator with XRE-family HTH domain
MIRTDAEYNKALERLHADTTYLRDHRAHLESIGLSGEMLERALQPAFSFHEQLKEEVETFERMRRGELGSLTNLSEIGRWLIGVRISKGLTQRELAARLGVSEAQVSRDERNEYHGVSVDRAQFILQTMGVQFRVEEDFTHPEIQQELPQPPPVPVANPFFVHLRASRKLDPERARKLAEKFQREFDEEVAAQGLQVER